MRGMLTVQAVGDVLIRVQGVEHPICIVLHGCCENHYFIKLRHLTQELLSMRSDKVVSTSVGASHLKVMYKCLIQVQHKCVHLTLLNIGHTWQIRSDHFWQFIFLIFLIILYVV
jgi:hypothetical protein